MIINGIEYLTSDQAAELVGKHVHTIRKMVKLGMLTAICFSVNKRYLKKQDVLDLFGKGDKT